MKSTAVEAAFLAAAPVAAALADAGVRVPRCFAADLRPSADAPIESKFALLLEDYAPAQGWRQERLLSPSQARATLSALARMHALFTPAAIRRRAETANVAFDEEPLYAAVEAACRLAGAYWQPAMQPASQMTELAATWEGRARAAVRGALRRAAGGARRRPRDARRAPAGGGSRGRRGVAPVRPRRVVRGGAGGEGGEVAHVDPRRRQGGERVPPRGARRRRRGGRWDSSTSSGWGSGSARWTPRTSSPPPRPGDAGVRRRGRRRVLRPRRGAGAVGSLPPRAVRRARGERRGGVSAEEAASEWTREEVQEQYEAAVLDLCRVVFGYQWVRVKASPESILANAESMNKNSYNKSIDNARHVLLVSRYGRVMPHGASAARRGPRARNERGNARRRLKNMVNVMRPTPAIILPYHRSPRSRRDSSRG